jgi:hypothetical protein
MADDSKFIHIVGGHKSGTSWLLHILAAHPSIIAWREFDSIRAAYSEAKPSWLNSTVSRYRKKLKLPVSKNMGGKFICKSRDNVIRDVFCGRGWLPIMNAEIREQAVALDYSNSGHFIDEIMALADKKLSRDGRPLIKSGQFSNTLGPVNTTRSDLINFLDAIKKANDMSQAPVHFFEYLQRQCEPNALIALKAADQLMCLRQLKQLSPRSKKIAIVRDGRDVAISAKHFSELMRREDAPWKAVERSYLQSLRAWAGRTRVLSNAAKSAGVTVLRYEDLKRDFFGLGHALFTELKIPTSEQDLKTIHSITDFSTITGGREVGTSATHRMRKGTIGEWKSVLSEKEAELAWRVAGPELERYGYSKDGEYRDGVEGVLAV